VSFITSMYKTCIYCLMKARFGFAKVLLCIHLVFGFFGAIWLFSHVDLAFFLGNPVFWDVCLYAYLVS